MSKRNLIWTFAAAIGTSALALYHRAWFATALRDVLSAGWVVLPAFGLFLVQNQVATQGWRALSSASTGADGPSVWRLALARLEAQALNLVVPASGEVLRASRMSGLRADAGPGGAAVALDVVATTIAEALFALAALASHRRFRPTDPRSIVLLALLGALALLAGAFLPSLLAWLFARLRVRDTSRFGQFLAPIRKHAGALNPAFRRAVGWHVLECAVGIGEIWLIAASLGVGLSGLSAWFAAAALRALSTLGFFVPAQLGVAEGSLVFTMSGLGHPASVGLAIALARRARQLLTLLFGVLVLFARTRWQSRGELHADPVHPAG